ncbi:unnamed protein product [Fraxinus pennsylvanica]|uniref:Uncharacterized protein n=1 Tax=Fraxinus pennsylvanica TaxID=56036 RepID=A0AAD2ACF6_9LAMI|nr:unnamed protein product [Fraxinus pennsylvanica]
MALLKSGLDLMEQFLEVVTSGNTEAYAIFKIKLKTLPEHVAVASHTQTDNRKDKFHPGGLLFTKFRSNPKALVDPAFQDNFGRLHDRSNETPKTMKQLNCLFPKNVPIQIPQDETGLLDWKQQLDRDVETRKFEANICSICSAGFECPFHMHRLFSPFCTKKELSGSSTNGVWISIVAVISSFFVSLFSSSPSIISCHSFGSHDMFGDDFGPRDAMECKSYL